MEYFFKKAKVQEIVFLERCCNFRKGVIRVVSNSNTLNNLLLILAA